MKQKILSGYGSCKRLNKILEKIDCHKFLLVCDSAFEFLNVKEVFQKLPYQYTIFNEFTPNPVYEDICNGVELFQQEGCDAVVAVGGGSSIDVAKCIKLFSSLDSSNNYLTQEYHSSDVPLIAVPTTAGTGSEATHFAVLYFSGQKQSVAHECLIPDYAILDYSLLNSLSLYQKKCTMLDALCHGIESWWSVKSTDESKKYAELAIRKIIENKDEYLAGKSLAAEQVLLAANFAGKAINITQTTAAHAMSYKLTSLYGLPHGHAVAIVLPRLWSFMNSHFNQCVDKRGVLYLKQVFADIAHAFGASDVETAISNFDKMLNSMGIFCPQCNKKELDLLVSSVNVERLKNNPVELSTNDFAYLYGCL